MILATLDSTLSEPNNLNSRQFMIKDGYSRLECIFYEIDQKLDRIPRGKYIRY
jgi:hypothetical protein